MRSAPLIYYLKCLDANIIRRILCFWMRLLCVRHTFITALCVCLCRKAVMRRMSTCCRPSCVWEVTTWIKSRPVYSVETAETATCAKPNPVPPSAMLKDSTDEPLTNTPQRALTERSSKGQWNFDLCLRHSWDDSGRLRWSATLEKGETHERSIKTSLLFQCTVK